MKHPNLYNDNIVATHTGHHGTHIHIDNGVMGHAIIRTHGPDGELLAGEKDTKNPRRDVVATGKPQYIHKMFKSINESVETEQELQTEDKTTNNDSIKTMIESILAGELTESTDQFSNILTDKIAVKLEEAKIAVAKSLFGIAESEEKDEKQSETSDEDFHKSLHARLKTAEDMDDNPLKDDEKENPNDKRVIAGLKARAAKGEMSKPNAHRDIPLKSGSVTLKDGEAKHINHFLGGLKPEKRKEVLDHMHKSPEHFNKVHDVIKRFPGYSQHSSIYKDERA